MDRDPVKRLLDDWDSVASAARPPAAAPQRGSAGAVRSTLGLLGAAAAAVIVVIGVVWLGGRISPTQVGGSPSPIASGNVAVVSPSASPSPSPTRVPSATLAPTASPTATAPATPAPTPDCGPADLAAAITAWDGAAGSRIATVTLTVNAAAPCTVPTTARPALIDAHRAVLAQGRITNGNGGSAEVGRLLVNPGDVLTTLVQVSNVCGAPPAPPVTVAFDLGGAVLIATPLSPTDDTVPPCNGPSLPASIEMHPWSR